MTSTDQYKKLSTAGRRAEVVQEIKKFHSKHGRIPVYSDLGSVFHARVQLVFGTWEKAVNAALGIDHLRKNWTDEDLLDLLREIHKRTGQLPTTKDVLAVKVSLKKTLTVRFGSLAQAIEKAIATSPRIEVLRALKELTPPPCDLATCGEITQMLNQRGFALNKMEVGIQLDDLRRQVLVTRIKYSKTAAWSLTRGGEKFLREFNGRRRD